MRAAMMWRLLGCVTVAALLVSAGAADARGNGRRGGLSFASEQALPSGAHGESSSLSPISPLPLRAPLYSMARPSVPEGQIGAAPNPGPVTGYGPGGMSHSPGRPGNPPY
jgi:hypothetical protein